MLFLVELTLVVNYPFYPGNEVKEVLAQQPCEI